MPPEMHHFKLSENHDDPYCVTCNLPMQNQRHLPMHLENAEKLLAIRRKELDQAEDNYTATYDLVSRLKCRIDAANGR